MAKTIAPNTIHAGSLAAITAGAVAAAFLIMSIGSLITIISIGAAINPGVQATAGVADEMVETGALMLVSSDKGYASKKSFKNHGKNYFLDAVLREESAKTPVKSPEPNAEHALPISKVNHIFADAMAKDLSSSTLPA